MKPGRFWTVYATCVLFALLAAALFYIFTAVLAKPQMCETVQTHENRSVTLCR